MTDAAPTHDHAVHPTSGAAETGAGCDPATEVAAIQAHADLVFATCRRVLGNDQDAADAAQEVFVAWLRGGRRIRGSVAAWLHGAAVRRCLDLRRRQHRRAGHEAGFARQSALESPDATDGPDHHALRAIVDEALHQLDAPSRALLLEHHVLGRSQVELATRFRTTQATISRRLAKAAEALKAALRRRGVVAPAVYGGVMSGVLSAQANAACPSALSAPLLAQAQVAGSAALTGATKMKLSSLGGGALVLKIAGWTAAALLALVVGGAVASASRAAPAPSLDPPIAAPPVGRPLDGPLPAIRYPSIETLIASLDPVDVARQERLAQALDRQLSDSADTQVEAAFMAGLNGMPPAPDHPGALAAEAWLAELEQVLVEGPVRVDSAGWLEANYRAGRCGSVAIKDWIGNRISGCRKAEHRFIAVLHHRPDPRHFRAWLAWAAALRKQPLTHGDALVAFAGIAVQNRFATEADLHHRLPPEVRRAWLNLPVLSQADFDRAVANEKALFGQPYQEDLRSGRTVPDSTIEIQTATTSGGMTIAVAGLPSTAAGTFTPGATLRVDGSAMAQDQAATIWGLWGMSRITSTGARLAMVLRERPDLVDDLAVAAEVAGIDPADPTLPQFTIERRADGSAELVPQADESTITRLGTVGDRLKVRLAKPNDRSLRWPVAVTPASTVSIDDEPAPPHSRF